MCTAVYSTSTWFKPCNNTTQQRNVVHQVPLPWRCHFKALPTWHLFLWTYGPPCMCSTQCITFFPFWFFKSQTREMHCVSSKILPKILDMEWIIPVKSDSLQNICHLETATTLYIRLTLEPNNWLWLSCIFMSWADIWMSIIIFCLHHACYMWKYAATKLSGEENRADSSDHHYNICDNSKKYCFLWLLYSSYQLRTKNCIAVRIKNVVSPIILL